jgi:hypothetical protein
MSAPDIAAGLIGAVGSLIGLAVLPRVWRGLFAGKVPVRGRLRPSAELSLPWWPFGDATRRGAARGVIAGVLWWWGLTVFFWTYALDAGQSRPAAYHVVITASEWWMLIWFAVMLSVMFFNWPKWIVPPVQRAEPGAVAEWRADRRRRHRRP